MKVSTLLVLLFILQVTVSAQTADQIKNEVWQREEQYWKYVEQDDTTACKTLWHKNFIGYPGDSITDKSHITDWIADLFKDKNLKFTYALHKKAVNVIDDVVMTFYDVDDVMKNKQNKVVEQETNKITHTWKKFGNAWLIIGGMAGYKK